MQYYDYTPSILPGKTHIVSLCLKKQNLQVKGVILVRVYRSLLLLLVIIASVVENVGK